MGKYYLAIDIGASSGRHIIGTKKDGEIICDEVFRFQNGAKEKDGHLIWDIEELFLNVLEGIKAAFSKYKAIESVAIDTWGVDYVLLKDGKEILPAYAYRDSRTEAVIPKVHGLIPQSELYKKTGIQFQPFNTVYQLYCDKLSGRLDDADCFLMMPEYLSYKLCGKAYHEYTNASTTALIDPLTKDYHGGIIKALDLPSRLFSSPVMPKTVLGELKEEISRYVGGKTRVVLTASHDTASAVEGIPIDGNEPFISSGTWSLLGAKVPCAITTEKSFLANYSNEGGVGYIRYLKNIMGMWVINNLKKELSPNLSYGEIMKMAEESSFDGTVDLTDSKFMAPDSMAEAFISCFEKGKAPKTAAELFRCAHLSLAKSYKRALDELSILTSQSYTKLYIVGGGAKNTYLNKLTEKICNIKVIALPIEATAIGNLKIQMEAEK